MPIIQKVLPFIGRSGIHMLANQTFSKHVRELDDRPAIPVGKPVTADRCCHHQGRSCIPNLDHLLST